MRNLALHLTNISLGLVLGANPPAPRYQKNRKSLAKHFWKLALCDATHSHNAPGEVSLLQYQEPGVCFASRRPRLYLLSKLVEGPPKHIRFLIDTFLCKVFPVEPRMNNSHLKMEPSRSALKFKFDMLEVIGSRSDQRK